MRELGFDSLVCKTHWDVKEEKTKHTTQRRLLRLLFSMIATVAVLANAFVAKADAAIYYISPAGSDSNPGTSSLPWKTFGFVIPRLQPGDTIVLKNGTYTAANSGLPNVVCGSNAKNGTELQPVTVKAENERQAHIRGDGSSNYVFRMQNCSYWNVEGIRVSSADNPSQVNYSSTFLLEGVSNIRMKRLLVHHNNRYANGALLSADMNNSLLEESEFYYFHRNGLAFTGSNNVFRRNYVNSRSHADIASGYASHSVARDRGDDAFVSYPGAGAPPNINNLFENNISEGNEVGYMAINDTRGTLGLGNISLNDLWGISTKQQNETLAAPSNNTWWHTVVINPQFEGTNIQNSVNTRVDSCTIIGNNSQRYGGLMAQVVMYSGVSMNITPSFFSDNCLVINSVIGVDVAYATPGYQPLQNWLIRYSNSYGNSTANYSPASDPRRYQPTSTPLSRNPQLGTCRVFIPDTSPMKGAGLGGADIGANVLYRYENGVLTNQPLWNPVTGQFPHGVIVPGLNDIPGSSAFDVHERLNVNANGCSLPAGYGGRTVDPGLPVVSRPTPPRNLQIVR